MRDATTEIRFTLLQPRPVRAPLGATAASALPRISRLMALAIKLERDRNQGCFDYAELSKHGRVSRTRITQIFNLLHLAPDLQERLLFLEPTARGRERVSEKALRRISGLYDWKAQRRAFESVISAEPVAYRAVDGRQLPHWKP